MRALILLAGTALALSGCSNDDQAANSQNIDESLTAENIVSNDVTAIDAVTAADANMAADVNYTDVLANELDNLSENRAAAARTPARRAPTPRPAPEPATTAPAENAATNSTE